MDIIDARGFSCPQPVLMVKKALTTQESSYTILVDHPAAKENVSRFATHSGFQVSVTETGSDYTLHITK